MADTPSLGQSSRMFWSLVGLLATALLSFAVFHWQALDSTDRDQNDRLKALEQMVSSQGATQKEHRRRLDDKAKRISRLERFYWRLSDPDTDQED